MFKVYLIAGQADSYVVEFDSCEECEAEFEERLIEEPYRINDEFVIIADAVEVDPFDPTFKSDTVLMRTGTDDYLITYDTSIYETFEDFREEIICDVQDLNSEGIFCEVIALTRIKKYKGVVTVTLREM